MCTLWFVFQLNKVELCYNEIHNVCLSEVTEERKKNLSLEDFSYPCDPSAGPVTSFLSGPS